MASQCYNWGSKSEEVFPMKNKKLSAAVSGAVLVIGLIAAFVTQGAAVAEGASNGSKLLFSCSLILLLIGAVALICTMLPKRRQTDVHTLAMAAVFAALCYIGFEFFKIDIPVGTEKTAFHLGNVFCVLAALFIGGYWGGLAGAVGMTIADLTSSYITSAPKTFLLKLCIGLIAGFVAHSIFRLSQEKERKVPLPVATVLSCAAGMVFNMVADPVVGYFYKMYVLGVPQKAVDIWVKMGAVTTAVNAVVAIIVGSVLYLALRPALKKANLLPRL